MFGNHRIPFALLVLALSAYLYTEVTQPDTSNSDTIMSPKFLQREHIKMGGGRKAVVLGATGATGRQVLDQLLASPEWEKVVVVGRRSVPQKHEKLVEVVSELDQASLENTKEHWQGATNVFNCIGTTRKIAKTAENFVAIEAGITESTAKFAKQAGVPHYSVVSAQGANVNVPAVSWFHPMLYTNTLGRKEKAVIDQKFPRTTILQPGMLDRMTASHGGWGEGMVTYMSYLGKHFAPIKVSTVAEAMIADAESTEVVVDANVVEPPVYYSGNVILEGVAAEARSNL